MASVTKNAEKDFVLFNPFAAETFEKLDKIRKLAGELRYDFFEGFRFQFPGLSEQVENHYKNIVTFLGANKERALNSCSMITAKHYNDIKFKNLQIYYDIIYIDNCIQAKKILEIKDYQFPLIPQEQNIPRHIADNMFTTCLRTQPIKEENTDSSNTIGHTGNKTKKIYDKNFNEDSSSLKRPKVERCNSQMNEESDHLKDVKICYCASNHFDNGGETSENKCRLCFGDKNKNPFEESNTNATTITNLGNEGKLSKEVNGFRSEPKGTTVSFENSNNIIEDKGINEVKNANENSNKAIQNIDDMKEQKIREYELAPEQKRELSKNSSNTSTAGVKRKKIVHLHTQQNTEENTDISNTTKHTGNEMFPPKTKKIYDKNFNENSSSLKRPKIEKCNSHMNEESDHLKDVKICYCASNHFDNGGETSENKCRSCFGDKNKNLIEESNTNATTITNLGNEGKLSKEVNGFRSEPKGTMVSFENSNNIKEEKEINEDKNANVNSNNGIQNVDMKEQKITEYELASKQKRELSKNSSNTSSAGVKRKKIVQNINGRIDVINDSDLDVEKINHKKPNDLIANSKPGTSKAKNVDENEKRYFQSACQEAKQNICKTKTNIKDNKITSDSEEEKEISSNDSSTNDDINDSQTKDSDSESSDTDIEKSDPVWLQNLPLDKNQTCKFQDCTLSDKPHFRHGPIGQISIELPEQRAMIKYLVKNNCVNSAKGFEVWKSMINAGYLRNRTHKTLQTHFRKILLPNIEDFGLPKHIEEKFTKLRTEKEWSKRKDKNKKKRL